MTITTETPLFTVDNTFAGPIIKLNRPIHPLDVTLSDIEHTDHRNQGKKYDKVAVWQFGDLHLGLIKEFCSLIDIDTLKERHPEHHSVIFELFPSLERVINTYTPFPYYGDKISLLNYAGVVGTETHFTLVDNAIDTLLDDCIANPDILINRLIDTININLNTAFRVLNDITESNARSVLIEGNASDQLCNDALSPQADFLKETETEIVELNMRIKNLEHILAEKTESLLDMKRKLLHEHLIKTQSKEGIDLIRRVCKEN